MRTKSAEGSPHPLRAETFTPGRSNSCCLNYQLEYRDLLEQGGCPFCHSGANTTLNPASPPATAPWCSEEFLLDPLGLPGRECLPFGSEPDHTVGCG